MQPFFSSASFCWRPSRFQKSIQKPRISQTQTHKVWLQTISMFTREHPASRGKGWEPEANKAPVTRFVRINKTSGQRTQSLPGTRLTEPFQDWISDSVAALAARLCLVHSVYNWQASVQTFNIRNCKKSDFIWVAIWLAYPRNSKSKCRHQEHTYMDHLLPARQSPLRLTGIQVPKTSQKKMDMGVYLIASFAREPYLGSCCSCRDGVHPVCFPHDLVQPCGVLPSPRTEKWAERAEASQKLRFFVLVSKSRGRLAPPTVNRVEARSAHSTKDQQNHRTRCRGKAHDFFLESQLTEKTAD